MEQPIDTSYSQQTDDAEEHLAYLDARDREKSCSQAQAEFSEEQALLNELIRARACQILAADDLKNRLAGIVGGNFHLFTR